ncbi:MAG TPA: hypothetical protein VFS95_01145 [Telluria sp.]|nr:hypothetical protein [Telluria sp.]
MHSIFKPFLFVLAIVGPGRSALAVDAPPRLWEVTGKSEQGQADKFYILPVTHNGFAAEHDGYFYNIVVPIAMSADLFLSEASSMLPADAPACTVPLRNTKENRAILENAHTSVERAQFDLFPAAVEMPGITEQDRLEIGQALHFSAHALTKNLSEYGLLIAMQVFLTTTQLNHPDRLPRGDADYMSRPDIADYLRYKRQELGKRANISVDEPNDLLNAYCNMGESRIRYLQRKLFLLDPTNFAYPLRDEIARQEAGYRKAIQEGQLNELIADAMDGYGNQFVCERNDKWFIKMRQGLAKGIKFYALGIAHVLQPAPENASRCDGLLTRLHHAGYSVKLLR